MPPTFEYVMVRLNAELVDRIDEIKDPLVPRDPFIRQLLSDKLDELEAKARAARRRRKTKR